MNDVNVFVGRQPIFNRKGDIYAYELLYRNSDKNEFPNISPEKATIDLLIHTFLTIGIDRVSQRTKSFINFTEKLLKHELVKQLDPKFVVIEILEDVEVTSHLVRQLAGLKKLGFTIALDDFVLGTDHVLYDRLFKTIDIIKVDYLNTPTAERKRIETVVKRYSNIELLAEKVETVKEFNEAKRIGYTLFQGYFFARPEIIKHADIPSNFAMHLHLMQKLNEKVPNIDDITNLLSHDVSLSYKLLRYINSLSFEVPYKIHSIKQAIMLMGLDKASMWLQMLLVHDMGEDSGKGTEKALIENSLTRAKICELLAKHKGKENTDEFFLAGMFSLIDVIMKRSWEDILPQLSLSQEITKTLHGEETVILPYVRLSEGLERFNWDLIEDNKAKIGITGADLSNISKEAHRWLTRFDS